jgi:predicted SprT family Zn-dependent metalloprotease
VVNNQKAQNPIPAYDSDFNRNLKKAGDKFLAHDIEIKLPLLCKISSDNQFLYKNINNGKYTIP